MMKEKSYLIFAKRPESGGWSCLDDPVYELRALDPNLRIRENVHTGHLKETGYAIQVVAENDEQARIIRGYMKLRNIKKCLVITDNFAFVLDIEKTKIEIIRGYITVQESSRKNHISDTVFIWKTADGSDI